MQNSLVSLGVPAVDDGNGLITMGVGDGPLRSRCRQQVLGREFLFRLGQRRCELASQQGGQECEPHDVVEGRRVTKSSQSIDHCLKGDSR